MDIRNGKTVAIGIEPIAHALRFFARPVLEGEAKPPYIGSATLVRITDTELKIENMTVGGLTREHLVQLCWWAQSKGYERIYAERLPGHTLPHGIRRADPPIAEHFEIDIAAVMENPGHAR